MYSMKFKTGTVLPLDQVVIVFRLSVTRYFIDLMSLLIGSLLSGLCTGSSE